MQIIRRNGTVRLCQLTNILETASAGNGFCGSDTAGRLRPDPGGNSWLGCPGRTIPPTPTTPRTTTYDGDNRLLTVNSQGTMHDLDWDMTYMPLTNGQFAS
ncbi:MAG: hypothetical protein N2379_05820 [Verrucomicrobiae bacterium]|nr:hypothetical protein [Verrucomicrobiae bacterium]